MIDIFVLTLYKYPEMGLHITHKSYIMIFIF